MTRDDNSEEDQYLEPEPSQVGYLRIASVHGCAVDDVLMTDAMLRVLVALGSHATKRNDHWVCAKQNTIARRLGVSRQFVSEQCLELERLGYVSINAAYRVDGGRTSNDVKLLLDFQLPPERLRSMGPRKKVGRGGRPKTPPQLNEVAPPPQLNEVAPPATQLSCAPRNFQKLQPPQLPEVAAPATSRSCSNNREVKEGSLRGNQKNIVVQDDLLTSSLARSADPATPRETAPEARGSGFDDSALKRDPLTLTLIACLDYAPATRREWGQWRIAVNDLHACGATPDDIPRAIRGYQATYPRARVTPLALVGHWAEIQKGKPHDLAQLEISRRATAADRQLQAEREHADAERRAQEKREVEQLLAEYGYADGR